MPWIFATVGVAGAFLGSLITHKVSPVQENISPTRIIFYAASAIGIAYAFKKVF